MTTTLASIAQTSLDADVLHAIRDDECSLAIWRRQPLPLVEERLGEAIQDIRFETSLATLGNDVRAAMLKAGYAKLGDWRNLIDDIGNLATRYCDILRMDRFELRLELVTGDACRKFHADFVTARLITTYLGEGTQWLEADDAARMAQGLEPRTIRTLSAGDVGIFKGKLATKQPAIHRSPPIGSSGSKRLLLVLNPLDSE